MLLLRFQGGLGNQLFQYAALYSIGKQSSQMIAYAGLPYRWTSRMRIALSRLLTPPFFPPHSLELALPYFYQRRWSNLFKSLVFSIRYPIGPPRYVEKTISLEPQIRPLTLFDDALLRLTTGGELSGFFQSEGYFFKHRAALLSMFVPSEVHRAEADSILTRNHLNPNNTCCLHVRRGDYLSMRNRGREEGWALPASYYHDAIARLPKDTKIVVISDDISWCQDNLASYSPLFITNTTAAIVDLWLMTRCRYNIISNSSFSWWGAWLNDDPERFVMTPKHFLGFAFGQTLPGGVTANGWHEVPVSLDS